MHAYAHAHIHKITKMSTATVVIKDICYMSHSVRECTICHVHPVQSNQSPRELTSLAQLNVRLTGDQEVVGVIPAESSNI